MRNRIPSNRGGSMVEFTLLIPIWLPLIVGTLWIGSSMIRDQAVTQMARDLASIYSRDSTNMNFQQAGTTATNTVLDAITQQLGSLDPTTGTGVVIFSTIEWAGASVCASANTSTTTYGSLDPPTVDAPCTNGHEFVFTQQWVQGNTSLMTSKFGTAGGPFDSNNNIALVDSLTNANNVSTFNQIYPRPAETGSDGYQSGQPIYVVEVYFKNPGLAGYTGGGDYAYAVF